jgi:glycerophosphoryl diester phosphodiesterase
MALLSRKPVFSVAHRGASGVAPENTVAAFDEAIRLGAPAVEFDLRLSKDNVPVVLHDATLDRTTTCRGLLGDHTWLDLLAMDAGSWKHPRFAGIRIPSLDEALLAIGPFARPVIELKVPFPPELLLASLRKYDLESEVLVISFQPEWLIPCRRASKELALGLLSDTWSENLSGQARALDAETLLLHTDVLGTGQVAAAEANGLEVWCFTPNEVGLIAACAAMGVTGIITDYPDLIRTR